jgi:Uncharacterised nucleotidyltransferase
LERPWADVQFLPRIGDEPSAGIGVGSMSRARESIVGRLAKALITNRLANAPPEFFIAVACSRWPPSETRSNCIRATAKAPVDWERFLGIVERHRIWGLARQGLTQAGVALPAEIDRALNAKTWAVSRRNLALAAETARLCWLFREVAIPAVFVKGVTLSVLAYGDIGIKHSRDIDILVSPARVLEARAVLERAGYALKHPLPALTETQLALLLRHGKEWEFLREVGEITTELHWTLTFNGSLMRDVDASSPLAAVRIGDAEIPTFRIEELFVYLCVHGARHSWSRMKWLADVAALLATIPSADIEALYRAAQRRGSGRCAAQALLLCERMLGVELPAALRAELRRTPTALLLEAIALDAMLGRVVQADVELSARALGNLRDLLSLFLLGGGSYVYLWRGLTRLFFFSEDIAAFALPRRLTWVYAILRVPLWALRRLKLG